MRSKNKLYCVVPGVLFALLCLCCKDKTGTAYRVAQVDPTVLELLAQSPGHTVLSRQTVIQFGDTVQASSISASGFIVPDERRTNKVSARVNGRIEKLYVKLLYQYVNKGEKLFDLYSPELTNAVSEYLFLNQKDRSSTLTAQAKLKLQQLGLMDTQLQEFEKAGTAPGSITFYSPYSGYIIPGNPVNISPLDPEDNTSGSMDNMNAEIETSLNTAVSMEVREGAYVVSGQTLFSINDAKAVIALINVPGTSQLYLKPGTPVTVNSELVADCTFTSAIELIEPSVQQGQHFLVGRVPLSNNKGLLKFNSLVTASMFPARSSITTLPSSCVYDLGKRKIVWIKSSEIDSVNVFTPRIVTTGSSDGSYIEITSGLTSGEFVALQAGTLTDRDGIISPQLP